MFKTYYELTKPGIIYGNLSTSAAGFFFAARGNIDIGLLLSLLSGTALVIASACVTNNILDRGIDRRMQRTRERALVTGRVSVRAAQLYAIVLGVVGIADLIVWTNILVVIVGLAAWVDYVVLYGVMKRRFIAGTLVGSISGAAPIVAGYVAVAHHFDLGALLVFLILVTWQMPHFYAIAMFRRDDYASAGVPVLTVKRDFHTARVRILGYIVAFTLVCALTSYYHLTGTLYLLTALLIGAGWLFLGLTRYRSLSDRIWGRQMFFYSLVSIMVISIGLAIGGRLP